MERHPATARPGRALIPVLALAIGTGASTAAHADDGVTEANVPETLIPHQLGPVTISGGLTWFLQATDGAPNNTTALTYSADLVFEAPLSEHSKAVVALEAGEGLGVDAVINPLSITNYDAFTTDVTSTSSGATDVVVPNVSQAYFEGEYLAGRLVVDVGKLDVHATYDTNAYANDETDQFLSGMFVRGAGSVYPELDRYYAPGAALSYGVSDMIDVTMVVANGNNTGFENIFDYPYAAAQINVKPTFAGRDGNYRFYAISDARHQHFTKIDGGDFTSSTAYGISFDQAVTDHLGLFARWSQQDDSIAENVVKGSWSVGAALAGAMWGREADVVGIGYGVILLNGKADPAAVLGFADTGDESHLEAYYKYTFSEHLTLTADVQVLQNLGGNANADTVTVAGVRGQLNF